MGDGISNHYFNGQCVDNIIYQPEYEVCTDDNRSTLTIPPDQKYLYVNTYVPPSRERGWSFPFLFGCSDEPRYSHPYFDNPGITPIDGSDLIKWSPSLNRDGSIVAFARGEFSHDTAVSEHGVQYTVIDGVASGIFVYDRSEKTTEHVPNTPDESEINGASHAPKISADGRFVVFTSLADNLVVSDNNGHSDIFVYDRQAKTTERVSISSTGEEANNNSHLADISADGRYVVFNSSASNLSPFSIDGIDNVYVYDRETKTVKLASLSYEGYAANGGSGQPTISGNGRFVAFGSWASNLIEDDHDDIYDVFLRDMIAETTARISISYIAGKEANGNSSRPRISDDGAFVTFQSKASNLVEKDKDSSWDVFIHDAVTGRTTSCTTSVDNDNSVPASISADGRYVVFNSLGKLTPDDKNDYTDILVCDTSSGSIARVSRAQEGGTEIRGNCGSSTISGDGKWIAFTAANDVYNDLFLARNPLFNE